MLAIAITVALTIATNTSAGDDNCQLISWHSDVNQAWELTLESQQPLLLYITQQGCPYCVLMESKTFKDVGVVADIHDSFVAAMVHAEKRASLIDKLGVDFFPSTVIISPDNHIIGRIDGYVDAARFRQRLEIASRRDDSPPR